MKNPTDGMWCTDEYGTQFIIDKYFDNLQHHFFRVKKLTNQVILNHPHQDSLLTMAKVNAIIAGRPESNDL